MATDRREASFTRATLVPLLKAAGRSGVLVGGQALAVWVDYFGIAAAWASADDALITRDVDFLGDRALAEAVAKAVPARTIFPPRRALTALVAQVEILRPDNTCLNVDVIARVVGLDAAAIRRRAVEIEFPQSGEKVRFAVMHPVDVLSSRLANLVKPRGRQSPAGVRQLQLAIQVVRQFIARVADEDAAAGGQVRALKAIEAVVRLAASNAGRKARKSYGIDFLDAIPADHIRSGRFQQLRWPRLLAQLRNEG